MYRNSTDNIRSLHLLFALFSGVLLFIPPVRAATPQISPLFR